MIALTIGLAVFVLTMSSVILAQEIHLGVGIAGATLTAIAAAATYGCTRYAHCPLRRFTGAATSGPIAT